jgi:SAM-dependent methyltransferase
MKTHDQTIEQWLSSPPGSYLFALEQQFIQRKLARHFADVLVQLGGPSNHVLTETLSIRHRLHISPEPCETLGVPYVRADYRELPLIGNSVDVVVVLHVLEQLDDPKDLLEQIDYALVPNGKLFLFAFNPLSCVRLPKIYDKLHHRSQITNLLKKMGYGLEENSSLFYRPFFKREKLWRNASFLDRLGNIFLPGLGSISCILAQKKVVAATPLMAKWWPKQIVIQKHCAEPTTRAFNEPTEQN